jgi:uncharacterized coiled-coil protein SlyX
MSYIGQEDWVHIDAHNDAMDLLGDRIADLEASLDAVESDEAYTLARIIELRWRYSDYSDMHQELEELIKEHASSTTRKAIVLLNLKYPKKTGTDDWGITWLDH